MRRALLVVVARAKARAGPIVASATDSGGTNPPHPRGSGGIGQDRGVPQPSDPSHQEVDEHPLVGRVRAVADDVLVPAAAEVDASQVPRSHLDALADAGVFGMSAPPGAGGAAAPPAVVRRVHELLAGADLSTWFVQAQHHQLVRMLAATGRRPELLADLAAGRLVAGIAFSHLRRRPDRVLTATADGDGWRFDGTAPWYTGWGLNDVALVAALTEGDDVVWAVVDAREGPHLHGGPLLRTAALSAARTVTLELSAYPVPAHDVLLVEPAAGWAAGDALVTVNAPPAVFGLAGSALRLLAEHGVRRREPAAVAAAAALGAELDAVRARAYQLVDDVPPGDGVAERLSLRARALRLGVDAGTALVTAGAGGAMAAGAPAQRKAREALFLLVQAQTADVRAATLATFT
jgi:alkylation response protein AidB-like acyl-CoA dehydrogenase